MAAGLDGIRKSLDPGAPVVGRDARAETSAAPLPRSPDDALAGLHDDAVIRDAFRHAFVDAYSRIKRNEIARFTDHIPDWEISESLALM